MNDESENGVAVLVPTAIENIAADIPIKKFGRPKGSTKESKCSDIQRLQLALNHAATESFSIKEDAYKMVTFAFQRGLIKKWWNKQKRISTLMLDPLTWIQC
jgi:hypothetical protein